MRKSFDEFGLIIVALIFGFSYVFQNLGAQHVPPFIFNLFKNLLGTIAILPFCTRRTNTNHRNEVKYGIIIGLILAIFSYFQQVVVVHSSTGKVGFITSLYIVEVPLINSIIYKDKMNLQTILGIILSFFGLVLLCNIANFKFSIYDLFTIICSFILSAQIIILDKYATDCDPFKLNFYTFIFISTFSLIASPISREVFDIEACKAAIIPLLYVGIACTAIALPLQTYCQKTVDGTTSSLILSLESVFSVVAGYLILNQTLTKIELIGCIIMFIGVILCVTSNKKKN